MFLSLSSPFVAFILLSWEGRSGFEDLMGRCDKVQTHIQNFYLRTQKKPNTFRNILYSEISQLKKKVLIWISGVTLYMFIVH